MGYSASRSVKTGPEYTVLTWETRPVAARTPRQPDTLPLGDAKLWSLTGQSIHFLLIWKTMIIQYASEQYVLLDKIHHSTVTPEAWNLTDTLNVDIIFLLLVPFSYFLVAIRRRLLSFTLLLFSLLLLFLFFLLLF